MTLLVNIALPGAAIVDRFRSPRPIERVALLEARNYNAPGADPFPVRHRFAQVVVPKCRAGDLLEVEFDMEASNALPNLIELAWSIRLTQSRDGFEGIRFPGASKAVNVTPAMHHYPVQECCAMRVPSDGDWFVIAMVYAGGGSWSVPGEYVTVERGYGDFTVKRTRG